MKLVKARIDLLPKPALDFVIAKAQGMQGHSGMTDLQIFYNCRSVGMHYYCTKWEDAGPVIAEMVKRGMRLSRDEGLHSRVAADMWHEGRLLVSGYQTTAQHATMLCLAKSMHGEYVDVPEELL